VVTTAAAQAVIMATQIGSVVILSRLLSPTDFGLIAMCAPIVAFLAMVQDFGLVQATVQRRDIRHAEVNLLFWVNVGVSVAMTALLIVTAPLIAQFYGDPRVGPLIAAMALVILVGGLGAQHGALLNRRMEFLQLAVIAVAGAVAALAVATVWAMISPSYWALFGGMLAGSAVPTLGMWASSRWRPGLPRAVPGGRALLGFGAGITGFNLSNFVARNLDNVLIGRVWGGAELGLYDRAYKLLLLPLSQVANPLARVMIPTLSRMQDEPDRYRHAFLRVLRLVLLLVLPGVACAVALSDVLIPFVLGDQWRQTAPIFTALGFAGLVQLLNNPAGWLFISQGRSRDYMIWGFATAAIAATAFIVGLPYGALGVAVAYAVSEYLKTPILWTFLCRKGPLRRIDILRDAGPTMLAAHLALAGVWLARPVLPEAAFPALLIGVALAYLIALAAVLPFRSGRATLAELAGFVSARLAGLHASRKVP
jgi:polysaccharide transporter, PST family